MKHWKNYKQAATRILILVILLAPMAVPLKAQLVPGGLIYGFEQGDAKSVSSYFHSNIELKVHKKKQITSKNQAQRILQDFFKDHKPVSFSIDHEGTNADAQYSFGTLRTQKDYYRVSFYFLEGSEKKIIYYLSIEKL